jgi:excisionase family DNA binding protein
MKTKRKKLIEAKPPAYTAEGVNRPLSIRELCQYVSVTVPFLDQEVAEQRLRAVRLGTKIIRFLPADIKAWIERTPSTGDEFTKKHQWKAKSEALEVGA